MYMNGQWSPTAPTIEFIEAVVYGNTGSSYPASVRFFNYPSSSDDGIGFRVTLFLNS